MQKVLSRDFSAKLRSFPLHNSVRIFNSDVNKIYDTTNPVEELFYKKVFPSTFNYLSTMNKFFYLTVNQTHVNKVKNATEELHQIFVKTTENVLQNKNLYKRFNVTAHEWNLIRNNFYETKDEFFYGRMDLGFSLDFNNIKLFEYNTGLCGDIYDTTHFQKSVFNHYALNNKSITLPDEVKHSTSSGDKLIDTFGNRWEYLLSNSKNKTVYFICTPSKEEKLVLSSFIEALEKKNIKYKVCLYGKGLKLSDDSIIDEETNEKVDVIYKTYAWYKIFNELFRNPNHKKFFEFFLSKKTKIIEPMWKTIMGNKALLPYAYKMSRGHPLLLPSSFDPRDRIFGEDEYVIEKGLRGRASMMTKKVRRADIKEKKKNVIYQKIFSSNFFNKNYFILGSWIVGEEFGGMFIKKSKEMINEYNCNVIPVRITNH